MYAKCRIKLLVFVQFEWPKHNFVELTMICLVIKNSISIYCFKKRGHTCLLQ